MYPTGMRKGQSRESHEIYKRWVPEAWDISLGISNYQSTENLVSSLNYVSVP